MMLTDKLVLVTGASRGIGQAIALTLGAAGATVIGTATTEKGAKQSRNNLSKNKINGQGMILNVTDDNNIAELMKNINEKYGTVDILINNAGITRDNILIRMKQEEWDEKLSNTNLASVFKMSKAVLRGMMKKKAGRIISITSVVGAMGNSGQTNYAAAKAGIMGFTKSSSKRSWFKRHHCEYCRSRIYTN